jgi:hypothetical protein
MEIGIDIKGLLQAETLPPGADQPQHLGARVHIDPRIRSGEAYARAFGARRRECDMAGGKGDRPKSRARQIFR